MADYYLSPVVDGETFEPLVKVGDTLEIGTEVYYDGAEVPEGWEQVDDPNEYSTTEQVIGTFLGKPLYRKVIDFGNMPNNTTSYVAHGISNIGLVFIKGTTNDYYQIPFRNISNGNSITTWHNANNVFIQTNFDGSSIKATLVMEYTKTTD